MTPPGSPPSSPGSPSPSSADGLDFRRRPRRRGPALEEPIYDAVLGELAEFGFARMSVERVAARAKTGKSALYRRWPTKLELVVDTLAHAVPAPAPQVSSGDLRADLLAFLRHMAAALEGPAGTAVRASIGELAKQPQLHAALRAQVVKPHESVLRTLVSAAVARGQARPGALEQECLAAGPALLRQHVIEYGPPIPDELIVRVVDNALIPMFRAGP